jgi:hypothetical protein
MKQLFLLLLLSVFFSGCEKDDICDANTPTTPKVVIEFYDAANPTTIKNVTNLGIIAPGFTNGFGFTTTSKIKVPLKTFQDTSILHFIQNGSIDPITDDNLDEITFNYSRKTVFVSRACGYKTLFTLNTTNPITVTPDSNNWIQNVIVSQPIIENEDETHIKIYF